MSSCIPHYCTDLEDEETCLISVDPVPANNETNRSPNLKAKFDENTFPMLCLSRDSIAVCVLRRQRERRA